MYWLCLVWYSGFIWCDILDLSGVICWLCLVWYIGFILCDILAVSGEHTATYWLYSWTLSQKYTQYWLYSWTLFPKYTRYWLCIVKTIHSQYNTIQSHYKTILAVSGEPPRALIVSDFTASHIIYIYIDIYRERLIYIYIYIYIYILPHRT